MNYFWSNTIWFVLLGITTVIELVFILVKAKNRKLIIALFFTVSGIPYNVEMLILNFLKAYNYHPMLFLHSQYDDNVAGNIFSQLSVTATAVLIAVLNLKYYWYFRFAILYGIIEELFIYLHIYEHYWYRTWMTVIGLLLLFWIAKKIYKYCLGKNIQGFFRYAFVFLGLFSPYMTMVWLFRIMGIFNTSDKFLPDKTMSTSLIITLDLILFSAMTMIVHYSKIKLRWKLIIIISLYIIQYIEKRINLEYFADGWLSFIIMIIKIVGMYLYVYTLDKLYDHTGNIRK